MDKEYIRVLRVLEYIGPRGWVEQTLANSIQGERRVGPDRVIRAATIGLYPEVLANLPEDIRPTLNPQEADQK
jgi:hypothetical protein